MSKGGSNKLRKEDYFKRLEGYLKTYTKVLIVTANNVGSHQLQKIRASLRGEAVLMMGKNTMIRKCIQDRFVNGCSTGPSFERLLQHVKGDIGLVFTNGDLMEVRNKLAALKVKGAAKAGTIAPCDVTIAPGITGLDPAKTSFFQAVGISTKVNRSAIEIQKAVYLIKAGNKVTPSQATLLQMLNIQPFQYSLEVKAVYADGYDFPPALLDLTDAHLLAKFRQGIDNIAGLGLQLGMPSVVSTPHALINGYNDILSVALGTNFSFPAADAVKERIANPEAFGLAHSLFIEPLGLSGPERNIQEIESQPEVVVGEDADVGIGGGLFDSDSDEEDY